MAVDERRVVQVFAPTGGGKGVTGSGYLIANGLVLTAWHVVEGATGPCEVRALGCAGWVVAGKPLLGDPECDAALLPVDLAAAVPPGERPPGLGRLVTGARLACDAVGFPWAQLTRDDAGPRRRTERIVAELDPLSGLAPGEAPSIVALDVRSAAPAKRPDGSPWAGMSGSVLIAGDLVVGIVILDPARFDPDRLGALLVSSVADDAVLGPLLDPNGQGRPALAAVEAAGVLSPGYQPQRPASEERRAPSLSRLLRADSAVVPFRGRTRELDDLEPWLQSPSGLRVAVVTGAGGAGKTRLAAELCVRAERGGSVAGFLHRGVSRERVCALAGRVPVLVVIDEANSRPRDVVDAIAALAGAGGATALRVVLVAREQGGWWSALRAEIDDEQDALDALETALLVELDAVEQTVEGRLDAFADAGAAFAATLEQAVAPTLEPDLSPAMFSSVFFIHLAALSAVLCGELHLAGRIVREDLIGFALEREARYWKATAKTQGVQVDAVALRRAVTLASLTSAGSEDEAARMLRLVPDFADAPAQVRPVARWLKTLYPPATAADPDAGSAVWFRALTPDPLAETLIARVTAEIPSLLERLMAHATLDQARVTLSTLAQTGHTHSSVVEPLREALTRSGDAVLAEIIEASLPQQTTALRELAVLATQLILDATLTQHLGPERDARAARLYNNQANRLSELGRREEALEAVEEAVAVYRGLTVTRPDAFMPDFAASLNNLSNMLSQLGRREEALEAVEEAVAIRRGLAAERPASMSNLPNSLNNQSIMLSQLGRREEALEAVEEAVAIYRGLAAERPAFMPDFASSLSNQSVMRSGLGRREEALGAVEEAVAIYRELAAVRPDAFMPDFAASLNNQSNRLSELGRRDEALAAVDEAVAAYRGLAAVRPDAFMPDLAALLSNQSVRLSELRRGEEALAAVGEAVAVYRGLAVTRPDAFAPHLAGSLNNQAAMLGELGRGEEALAAVEEAVAIRRGLAAERPSAFMPDLAMSLSNQSTTLGDLGRREEALAVLEEALQLILPMLERAHYVLPDAGLRLAQAYVRRCEEAGREPAGETLQRLYAVFVAAGMISKEGPSDGGLPLHN
jgi:tetratricopeptide (TPR) repeat protein